MVAPRPGHLQTGLTEAAENGTQTLGVPEGRGGCGRGDRAEPGRGQTRSTAAEGGVAILQPGQEWSIGMFGGRSPVEVGPIPEIVNPVLTRHHVVDVTAGFVADPFLVRGSRQWSMFFEVWDVQKGRGKIGLATSPDARAWTYERIVLHEPFHLSYPYVFEWDGGYYLLPESDPAKSVRLYKANQFPTQWRFHCTLLEGPRFVDSSIFQWNGRWWRFTETNPLIRHSTLRLFHAAHFTGPWLEHRQSPIVVGDAHKARPAGRVIVWQDTPIRFAQDCDPVYGTAVWAFAITELTPDRYAERALWRDPLLPRGVADWHAGGMHHIDLHRLPDGEWLAGVDGWRPVEQET